MQKLAVIWPTRKRQSRIPELEFYKVRVWITAISSWWFWETPASRC